MHHNPSSHLIEHLESIAGNLGSFGVRGELKTAIKQLLFALSPDDNSKTPLKENDCGFPVSKFAYKWTSGIRCKLIK